MKVRFALSVGTGGSDPDALRSLVERADEYGFDSLWFPDLPLLPLTDPLLAVAFAAAATPRMKLGIDLVPFGSEPFVVASKLAQLDHLTAGRLLVTLVPGLGLPGERDALGIAGKHRGHLLDALLPELRAWWAGDAVRPRDGAEPVRLPLLPRQDPLEIWLGGNGPLAIERAGKLADGWLGSLTTTEHAEQVRVAIQAAATAAGRTIDPEHFGMSIPYAHDEAHAEAFTRRRRPTEAAPPVQIPVGPGALRAVIEDLIAGGISKFVLIPTHAPESWDTELTWLADVALPLQH